MERFKEFFKEFSNSLLSESLDARIDDIASTGIFSQFGRDFIEDRFQFYKDNGVVPTEKISKNASASGLGDRAQKVEFVPLDEKDYEEVLPYVFKFVDSEIRDAIMTQAKKEDTYDDGGTLQPSKKTRKAEKHYKDLTLKNVKEDASQIRGTLQGWLKFRHHKDNDLPKSLRNKYDFSDLNKEVTNIIKGLTKDATNADNPDFDKPDGFTFLEEKSGLRLYKWHNIGVVCTINPRQKSRWLSVVVDEADKETHNWCVADKETAESYGKPDGDGNFQYPYYLIRKKNESGDDYEPYVLMHGNSLQAKDENDDAIDEPIAKEILPVVEDRLESIVYG